MSDAEAAKSLSKDLAIKLAISELEKVKSRTWLDREQEAHEIIANLLTGLGCEAVVEAWNECT